MSNKKGSKFPLVSICLPTHNRSGLLNEAIHSLLSQTYKNFELIICDNASTDHTTALARRWIKKDSRIRYFKHKKLIPAIDNFNSALKKAKGKYTLWAADDDVWSPLLLTETVKVMERDKKEEIALVAGRFAVLDQHGNIQDKHYRSFAHMRKKNLSFMRLLREGFNGYKANYFFFLHRTAILRSIGGYLRISPLSASDILTLYRIASQWKIVILPKILLYKREYVMKSDVPKLSHYFAWLFQLKEMCMNICLPDRFRFLYRRVLRYYRYTIALITQYHRNSLYLKLLAIRSSVQLFFHLAPNPIQLLRMREKIFFGNL